jgi:hypothetical protein
MYLHGWMTDNNIGPVLTADGVHLRYGSLDMLELSHELPTDNWLRALLQPLVSTVEVAGNVTRRNDPNGTIYELDPYLVLRWSNFPWQNYLVNTVGFGDGISYVTSIPQREMQDSSNNNAKRLLNYLMVEVTFALPSQPQWELVGRVNHRCGAWGAYGAGNLSSNAIGLGLRYSF